MLELMNLVPWVSGITGFWIVVLALIVSSENLSGRIVFKVIPFFMGLANLIVFYKSMGW